MTPEELSQILKQLLQPDTQIVKQATDTLKVYFKQVEALENLLQLMAGNPDQQVRQISCVYLRKIVTKLWPNLSPDQQKITKDLLLTRFKEEPVTLVKKNIANVIGNLGKILIPNKEWPQLFEFIFLTTQSNELVDKELAMMLLSVIIEYFGLDEVKTYYDQLNPIIEGYLASGIPSLQTLSIECVQGLSMIPKAVSVLKKYNKLIPLTINALDLDNEELVHKVFDMFNEFAEIKKVLGPHLPIIIEKALVIAANMDYTNNLREVTMLFLELIAENYSKVLIKNHGMAFIDKVFEVGFQIASEDPELYTGMEDTPPHLAVNMLYTYACIVHTEKVFPIIMKYAQQYATSNNEHQRAAATVIIGQIADSEACLDFVRDNINSLTNFLIDRMQDESYVVREAAGETVGRFSEHVGEDFTKSHKKVMPCLMRVVKDLSSSKHEQTVQKTLFALNEFVQNLEYDIKVYIEELISILIGYVNS
jgi:hypothetical protein